MTTAGRHMTSGCGAGLKPAHYRDILQGEPAVGWFEVHPENYMGAGGPPHAYLTEIRQRHALSLHGVGLSIGGPDPLDRAHLDRFKTLVDRYEPALVSEHLAWSTHQGQYFNDLLALPYSQETLNLVSDHVDQVQEHLGQRILLENPSTYVRFKDSTMDEVSFLKDVAGRTGCGLLLDINNVFVSCTNQGESPESYLDGFPFDLVGEVHLAGHAADEGGDQRLLIDTHDRPVSDPVWALYRRVIGQTGVLPTLIEWDSDIPEWQVLVGEVARADSILAAASSDEGARHVA
ncbi:MAG: DUF692 domain-containing protein [Rhodospirillales bacterium]